MRAAAKLRLTRPVALQLGEPRLALLDARPPSTSSKSQLASTAIAGLATSDSLDSGKFFPSAERLNAKFGLEIHRGAADVMKGVVEAGRATKNRNTERGAVLSRNGAEERSQAKAHGEAADIQVGVRVRGASHRMAATYVTSGRTRQG